MQGSKGLKALNRVLNLLQRLISISGWFIAALILGFGIKSGLQPFLAMALATVLGIIGLVVHEGGHYLGARLAGMPVLLVRIAALEIQVQRRGWRVRWSPQLKRNRLGGYVIPATNPQRPWRSQWMLVAVMGPLSNLVVGLLALGLGLYASSVVGAICLAFAAINLSMGLANLLPSWHVMPSDGMLLIAWYRHRDDQSAALAQARLTALTVAGVPSGQLPVADLQLLDQGAMPEPLMAFSYRLNAAQDRGDWPAAAQMSQELDGLLKARAGQLHGMSALIELLRAELAFCQACEQQDATPLNDSGLSADADWYAPWLRPRCQALRALLEGRRQQAEAYLAQAQQAADNSPVLSQGHSERLLAASLRQLSAGTCAASEKALGLGR